MARAEFERRVADETVTIRDALTSVVSDLCGDVHARSDQRHGFFRQGVRELSSWRLTIDGRAPRLHSAAQVDELSAQFRLLPDGSSGDDRAYSIVRTRTVGDGFHEDVTVVSHTASPLELELRIEAAADFADPFEVRHALTKRGGLYALVEHGRLVLGSGRAGLGRETWINSAAPEAVIAEDGLRFLLRVAPRGSWSTCFDVLSAVPAVRRAPMPVEYGHECWAARLAA